jgi:Gnt-I system high-affinity gluconate transporter
MTLLIVFFTLVLLVLLITVARINPFLSFLLVSIFAGVLLGIPIDKINASIQKGIGDTIGSIVIIIALGAMLGKLIADSGAAQKIAYVLMRAFGKKYIPWALSLCGLIVGIPLFYGVGFVLMVPLIFSIVYQYKLPAVATGLPLLAALSVTHGFLPPHPSPSALVAQFHADIGKTLFYGIVIAIPTIILAGPLFSLTLKKIKSQPLETFQPKHLPHEKLPGTLNSFLTALLPVILFALMSLLSAIHAGGEKGRSLISFFGEGTTVMLITNLVSTYTLGLAQKRKISQIMGTYAESVKDVILILLIIGGAGALKQILTDSGISQTIAGNLQNLSIHPLVLGWMIAALIRICVGSSTVAGLTAAGIIIPLSVQTHTDPNLMVLSIGAGSLVFSHVNDSGFWLFKEYFNVSVKDTFLSWTAMETIVAIAGLGGVLIINSII